MTLALAQTTLQLRDYQQEAIDAVNRDFDAGLRRLLLALPTGAGKTVIAGHLSRLVAIPRQWSTVMLVHRTELVRQSVAKFEQIVPGVAVGVVAAELNQLYCPITVASVQTLLQPRRMAELCRSLMPGRLIISDEAHHDAAPGRQGVIDELAATLRVGFTATPERGDGKGLAGHYQKVSYSVSMLRLMAQGKLAPLTGLRIGTGTSLENVKSRGGDFAERELAVVCDSPARNALIVRSWQQHAADRKRTVAFCIDVDHALHLAQAFQDAGIAAETVVGSTPEDERRDILARFGQGSIPVLTSCMVLTEGYDEPGIDCILHARPTQSRPLYIQMTGRGARTSDGKADCLVIDFVDNSRRFAIVSLDQLADTDPDALLEGRPAREPQTGPREDEPFDLLALARERDPRKAKVRPGQDDALLYERSPLRWREVAGVRMAPLGPKRYAILQPQGDGRYQVAMLDCSAYGTPKAQPLAPAPLDLGYSMGVCEDAADRIMRSDAGRGQFTRRDSPFWGRNQPPTDKQIALAERYRIPVAEGTTRQSLAAAIDDAFFTTDYRRWQRQGRLGI